MRCSWLAVFLVSGASLLWNIHDTLAASHSAGFVFYRARWLISISARIGRVPACDVTLLYVHLTFRLMSITFLFCLLIFFLSVNTLVIVRVWVFWLVHLGRKLNVQLALVIMRVLKVANRKGIPFLSPICSWVSTVVLKAIVGVNVKLILVCKRHHRWSLVRPNRSKNSSLHSCYTS